MKIDDLLSDARRICDKKNKLEKLPVSKDISRLQRKIFIYKNKTEISFKKSKELSQTDVLFNFLECLGKELQNVTLNRNEFDEKVNINDYGSITDVFIFF